MSRLGYVRVAVRMVGGHEIVVECTRGEGGDFMHGLPRQAVGGFVSLPGPAARRVALHHILEVEVIETW